MTYDGLGIAAFGTALLAGVGLVAAFDLFGLEPGAAWQNQYFLGTTAVICVLLEFVAIGLAGTALIDAKHKAILPAAALILACAPLSLVMAVLLLND